MNKLLSVIFNAATLAGTIILLSAMASTMPLPLHHVPTMATLATKPPVYPSARQMALKVKGTRHEH